MPLIYPDDFEVDPLNPLGTLLDQLRLRFKYEVATRGLKQITLAQRSGMTTSGLGHMLSPRRSMSVHSAQALIEAMDRTFDLRIITRSKARERLERLRNADEA